MWATISQPGGGRIPPNPLVFGAVFGRSLGQGLAQILAQIAENCCDTTENPRPTGQWSVDWGRREVLLLEQQGGISHARRRAVGDLGLRRERLEPRTEKTVMPVESKHPPMLGVVQYRD